jgi:2-octaprenyl-6-methoxyphenol hydroxylase
MQIFTFHLAIVGAGPVGLTLGLQLAQRLPKAHITLFDAQALGSSSTSDPRTLALSLGSIQILERLRVWPQVAPQSQAIDTVHVSQQQPALLGWPLFSVKQSVDLYIRASEEGVAQLGAVVSYAHLTKILQAAWRDTTVREPDRLHTQFGVQVRALKPQSHGVELDAEGVAEKFDLVVIAQGGLFGEQPAKPWQKAYQQKAWVGEVALQGATPGMAYERFTAQGPLALLPLPGSSRDQQRAALVWCVNKSDDTLHGLSSIQRQAVLNTLLPAQAGRITTTSDLKEFALGLSVQPQLTEGRIVRIGNAAQTLHPVAGQGLNLGLRDAHQLSLALARHTQIKAALQAMERARLQDRWSTIATTDFLARSFTWSAPGYNTWRGLGLAAMQMVRPLKSRLARQMMFG